MRKILFTEDVLTEDVSAFEYFIVFEGLTISTQIVRVRREIQNKTYSKCTILYCQMHLSQYLRFFCLMLYPNTPISWLLLIFAQSLLCLCLKMKFKEKLLVTKMIRSKEVNETAMLTTNTVASFEGKNNKDSQIIYSRSLTIFDREELDEFCCLCSKNKATVVGNCFHLCLCTKCHLKQV